MFKEYRAYVFEINAEENELVGRAIVYNSPAVITRHGFTFNEIMEDGALDGADLKDVAFLVNHNTSMIPLARSRNNNENSTMQLKVVPGEGMDIRVRLDTENNADARSLFSAVKRGDVSGMSFMFVVGEDTWDGLDTEMPTRHIRKIDRIFEVSAVTFPAYAQTSLSTRGLSDALDSVPESLESARAAAREIERKKQKIRIMTEVL